MLLLVTVHLFLLVLSGLEATGTVIALYDPSSTVNHQCFNDSDYQYNISELPQLINNTQLRICSSRLVISKSITFSNVTLVYPLGTYQSDKYQKDASLASLQQPCAPGFVHITTDESNCICSVNTEQFYVGIDKCNYSLMRAYRSRGYWIGYDKSENESEYTLLSGYCPPDFCSSDENLLLPADADREKMDSMMCSGSHTGVLCGGCKENHTVNYHSFTFKCQKEKLCKWGWLFYILSEIIPVTVIFLTIIFFNIPFTSGIINGFIFYAQVVEILHVTAGDFVSLPSAVNTLTRIHIFFYSFFNLNTFVLEELSFCMWKGANALDMIAFSYVTLVYSFLLIVLTVKLLNRFNYNRFNVQQGGIIHGLTAFLVLSYAHCARDSMYLMSHINLYKRGPIHGKSVLYYNGEIEWISEDHLPYCIPAIAMFIVIVIAPPIVLLVYPLHYKILSALHLRESKCVRIIFDPLERLKPLLDSFQGCFKDEYRFFSGLYLMYRFMFLFNSTMTLVEVVNLFNLFQLSVMLLLHAVCQPYKEKLHNVIDGLLFGNLALINAITLYTYSVRNYKNLSIKTSNIQWIQVLLVLLPLLLVPVRVCPLKSAYNKLFRRRRDEGDEILPVRMYGAAI